MLTAIIDSDQMNIGESRNSRGGTLVQKINGMESLFKSQNEEIKQVDDSNVHKYIFSFKILKLEFAPRSSVRVSICLHAGNKEIVTVNKPKIDPKRSGKTGR